MTYKHSLRPQVLVVAHANAGGSICLGRYVMLGGESVAKACTARNSLYISSRGRRARFCRPWKQSLKSASQGAQMLQRINATWRNGLTSVLRFADERSAEILRQEAQGHCAKLITARGLNLNFKAHAQLRSIRSNSSRPGIYLGAKSL